MFAAGIAILRRDPTDRAPPFRPLVRPGARPALADHGDLDPARVGDLLLDRRRGLVGDQRRLLVVDLAGVDDDADLAPGAHREHPLDPWVARGDVLEIAEPRDVLLERLTAGPGASARDRVGRLH